jgi:hypothetical protein
MVQGLSCSCLSHADVALACVLSLQPSLQERKGDITIIQPLKTRLGWWDEGGKRWPLLAVAARRLLPRHATSCAPERNWSQWGLTYTPLRNKLGVEKAEKLIFIAGNKNAMEKKPEVEVNVQKQQQPPQGKQHGNAIVIA